MKRRSCYRDRAALSFAYDQTVDHFGMWLLIGLIEAVSFIMRFAVGVLFLGMAGTSFFGTELFQAYMGQAIFDFSWFRVSFIILLLALALCLIFELIGGILDMGIMRIKFDLFDTQKSSLSQILSCAHLGFKHFMVTILYWGIVGAGLVLFIIPGIYFAIRLGFYRAVLVERACGPITALKESARLTCGCIKPLLVTGFLWMLLGLPFLLILVQQNPGMILMFFLLFPFLGLANIFIYKALLVDKER